MKERNDRMPSGFLPDETPPPGKLLLYALQQILVMFPATAAVALITGFPVSTTLFSTGLATICFLVITRRKIPLFFGASFAYLSAVIGLTAAQGFERADGILPLDAVRVAQFGILMSGLVSVIAGVVVKLSGVRLVEKLLPPHVTGAISIVIGLSLAGNAITDIVPADSEAVYGWIVALITLFSAVLIASYGRGIAAQLPLLLAALIGCGAAAVLYGVSRGAVNLFRSISEAAFINRLWQLGDGTWIALPSFSLPRFSWKAIAAIMPIAFATIPESVAHVYQLDIYVNNLAQKRGAAASYRIKELLGDNLIGDGCGDIVCGLIGAPAGTSYGENMSAMMISGVFSTSVLIAASVILLVLSCVTPLIRLVYCIPLSVIGGLEIYLFGAIAVQGIAIMLQNQCDVFSNRTIAVISSILVIGLGGSYAYGGAIPFFNMQIPAIAGASIFGILLNLLLGIDHSGSKKK